MQRLRLFLAAGFLVGGIPAVAAAADLTPQQLERLSQERMRELPKRNWGPPVPQSEVPQPELRPLSGDWRCTGVKAWQNIYAEPTRVAQVIGKGNGAISADGTIVDGYARVLTGAGHVGYVPAAAIHPYVSAVQPGLSCFIEGQRPDGVIQYGYR